MSPQPTAPRRANALPKKIFLVALALALLSLAAFELCGGTLEELFSTDAFGERLGTARAYGWLLGMALLVIDLLLPIPATGIMTALGMVYGFWLGWLVAATGSALAGILGYALVRIGGDALARRLAKPDELQAFRALFERWGALAVIGSRALPILPEVMAVLAGLARMRFRHFLAALLAGTVPVSALYAWWGASYGREAPASSFIIAVLLPLALWALFLACYRMRKKTANQTDQTDPTDQKSNPSDPSDPSAIKDKAAQRQER
ncbi:MAG: VTT domain-containing protein [Lentisphaeria bacterium]|nr:VTT domain-containing protein [Lentisphaeria bacterium]